jgi:hypothetical protein
MGAIRPHMRPHDVRVLDLPRQRGADQLDRCAASHRGRELTAQDIARDTATALLDAGRHFITGAEITAEAKQFGIPAGGRWQSCARELISPRRVPRVLFVAAALLGWSAESGVALKPEPSE